MEKKSKFNMHDEILEYVAGFYFNKDLTQVALIRKNRPKWQAGKLNGVGGSLETADFSIWSCMAREFNEEAGVQTDPKLWNYYATINGTNDDGAKFKVYFFACTGDLTKLKTTSDEEIEIVDVASINPLREDILDNLCWLVGGAVDFLKDGRPRNIEAHYV